MMHDTISNALNTLSFGAIKLNEPLAKYTTWRIGGPADYLVEIQSEEHLANVLKTMKAFNLPFFVIGCGSNLLFDDKGFRGGVIHIGNSLSGIRVEGDCVHVQAGAWIPRLALFAARKHLSGLEHAIGIPASVGGLVCMNGGSQRKNIGSLVKSVKVIRSDGTIITYKKEECAFAYRKSRFQQSDEIILEVELLFQERKPYQDQRKEMLGILRERNRKFPRKSPSCGSVFKSSKELYEAYGPPGKIIEDLGFKGKRVGNVQVFPHHANFIVNLGGGSSADVLKLVNKIQAQACHKMGISMEIEFRYVHSILLSRGVV